MVNHSGSISTGPIQLLGVGLYSIIDVARIVHANPASVRRWALGYTYRRDGIERQSEPILLTSVLRIEEEPVVTFEQLIELMYISNFRRNDKKKVPMPKIREAAEFASRLLGTDHPFAASKFRTDTDGKHIFMKVLEDQVTLDLNEQQAVAREITEMFFQKIDYGQLEAERLWPIGKDRKVVLDPHRSLGVPIDPRSGVPTSTVAKMFKAGAGEDIAAIADWYDMEPNAVQDAIDFEAQLGYKHPLPLAA